VSAQADKTFFAPDTASQGGKADQYFLRGFNLDHGTNIDISLDDRPVNMRTHAHGAMPISAAALALDRPTEPRWG